MLCSKTATTTTAPKKKCVCIQKVLNLTSSSREKHYKSRRTYHQTKKKEKTKTTMSSSSSSYLLFFSFFFSVHFHFHNFPTNLFNGPPIFLIHCVCVGDEIYTHKKKRLTHFQCICLGNKPIIAALQVKSTSTNAANWCTIHLYLSLFAPRDYVW